MKRTLRIQWWFRVWANFFYFFVIWSIDRHSNVDEHTRMYRIYLCYMSILMSIELSRYLVSYCALKSWLKIKQYKWHVQECHKTLFIACNCVVNDRLCDQCDCILVRDLFCIYFQLGWNACSLLMKRENAVFWRRHDISRLLLLSSNRINMSKFERRIKSSRNYFDWNFYIQILNSSFWICVFSL